MPKVTMRFKNSNVVTVQCLSAEITEETVEIESEVDEESYVMMSTIRLSLLDSVKIEN